ncbi:MAG: hypothetical protein ACK518_00635 [bacterium]
MFDLCTIIIISYGLVTIHNNIEVFLFSPSTGIFIMAQQHIESPIFVLVKFCSDQEITIAKSSDIVSAEMSSTSTKKINKVLATWKAQGTEIKVKYDYIITSHRCCFLY